MTTPAPRPVLPDPLDPLELPPAEPPARPDPWLAGSDFAVAAFLQGLRPTPA
jgi:hypothetical protein